jgi:hypothetical protein
MTEIIETIEFLENLADKLDKWAEDTVNGYWSTHQVAWDRAAANDCRRQASRLRKALSDKNGYDKSPYPSGLPDELTFKDANGRSTITVDLRPWKEGSQ